MGRKSMGQAIRLAYGLDGAIASSERAPAQGAFPPFRCNAMAGANGQDVGIADGAI